MRPVHKLRPFGSQKLGYDAQKGVVRVSLISLGCARNLVDSEAILGSIEDSGLSISEDIEDSDVAVVNTCAFIQEAASESIDVILKLLKLKEDGRLKHIIIYGCLPQRYGREAEGELKGVDAFLGIEERGRVAEVIRRLSGFGSPACRASSGRRYSLTPAHYAYLKISEGCGNRCSFCVIPRIKGPHRSRPLDAILREAEGLNEGGRLKEINLIGQDITLYGVDIYGERRLDTLLKRLAEIKPADWVRLLYMHPLRLSDGVIDVIADEPSICKYVDMPLQHINERILSGMKRGMPRKKIVSLIKKIRDRIPGAAIRTSFIVGFPGEGEREFKELYDFVGEMRFERLGLFRYSREEGTPAYDIKEQVPEKVKSERFDAIMSLQEKIATELNERFLGEELEILLDDKVEGEEGLFVGRTRHDAPEVDGEVYLRSESAEPGEIRRVRITDTYEYDLVAEEL